MTTLWVIIVLVVLWAIGTYGSLVRLHQRVKEAWADIDVQLKRRYNLIPNLVETVKGYAAHEKSTFENITTARSQAMQATSGQEKIKAENQLSQTLKSLFAVAENYPQLKASDNFKKLQDELTDTEDKIQASRRFYNGNVRDYNISVKVFPKNIMAQLFNFKPEVFFEATEEEKEVPQVKF